MITRPMRLAACAIALLAASPVLAQSGPPDDLLQGPASSAKTGADTQYFMPADPELSLSDQARVRQIMGPDADLSNLGFVKVSAIENALIHPYDAKTRARLVAQALNGAI